MKRHHITYLLFLTIIPLLTDCEFSISCYGWNFECQAINTTTLFKDGVPVDTFNFYATQESDAFCDKYAIKSKKYKEDSLFFSKDSALNFFHTEKEYDYRFYCDYSGAFNNDGFIEGDNCGLIVKNAYDNFAGTLFITPEGYKLLELYDYDSVTMFYSFIIYPYKKKKIFN